MQGELISEEVTTYMGGILKRVKKRHDYPPHVITETTTYFIGIPIKRKSWLYKQTISDAVRRVFGG